MLPRAHPSRRAFTLVEAALATLLIAGLAVALLQTLGALSASRNRSADSAAALALADELLNEVLLLPFADPITPSNTLGPGPGEAGTNRLNFDDVDDYDGFTESPPAQPDGTAIAGFTGWSRSVSVAYLSPANLRSTSRSTFQTLKLITVTVARNGITLATRQSIRGRGWDYAYALPPGASASDVTSARIDRNSFYVAVTNP